MNDRTVRRVGVNLLWLVPGEVGGSEEYTVRLLRELAELLLDDVEVILYVNRRFSGAHPDLVSKFTTRVALVSGSSRILRVLAESTWLAARLRRDRCVFVHHGGGTMPSFRLTPGVVTMHERRIYPFYCSAICAPSQNRCVSLRIRRERCCQSHRR